MNRGSCLSDSLHLESCLQSSQSFNPSIFELLILGTTGRKGQAEQLKWPNSLWGIPKNSQSSYRIQSLCCVLCLPLCLLPVSCAHKTSKGTWPGGFHSSYSNQQSLSLLNHLLIYKLLYKMLRNCDKDEVFKFLDLRESKLKVNTSMLPQLALGERWSTLQIFLLKNIIYESIGQGWTLQLRTACRLCFLLTLLWWYFVLQRLQPHR